MRLIDADELIKDRVENDLVRIAAMCAPTAYDVDKVVEQISGLSENEFTLAKVIHIVKAGGIDE